MGQALFIEDNQAITEGLAAMSMNFFAFFPALINPRRTRTPRHRLLRQPGRADWRALRRARRTGDLHRRRTRRNSDAAMKFLEWFVKDDDPAEVGRSWRLYLPKAILKSRNSARPRHTTRPSTSMLVVKDFWAEPEYAELLDQLNRHLYPYIVGRQGNGQGGFGRGRRRLDEPLSRSISATRNSNSAPWRPEAAKAPPGVLR